MGVGGREFGPGASDFIPALRERCQAKAGRIGFPDSGDVRVLRVADQLLKESAAAEVTLFTPKDQTLGHASQYGLDLARHGAKLRFEPKETRADRLAHAAALLGEGRLDTV